MTTAKSPIAELRRQAETTARMLKAAERGEKLPAVANIAKFEAALLRPSIKFAVAMDDKIITLEMGWATIRDMSETAIAEWILKYMRGDRDVSH